MTRDAALMDEKRLFRGYVGESKGCYRSVVVCTLIGLLLGFDANLRLNTVSSLAGIRRTEVINSSLGGFGDPCPDVQARFCRNRDTASTHITQNLVTACHPLKCIYDPVPHSVCAWSEAHRPVATREQDLSLRCTCYS